MLKRAEDRDRRADYRAGIIAATNLEPHRDRKKRSKPFSPGDFFPHLKDTQDYKPGDLPVVDAREVICYLTLRANLERRKRERESNQKALDGKPDRNPHS